MVLEFQRHWGFKTPHGLLSLNTQCVLHRKMAPKDRVLLTVVQAWKRPGHCPWEDKELH
jgi:hypothetical protein